MLTLDGVDNSLCQFNGTLATFQESLVHSEADAQVLTVLTNDVDLLLQVCIMTIEGNNDWLPKALHVTDMAIQVLQTFRQSFGIRFLDMFEVNTSMHLQTLRSGNNNHQSRLETRLATLDVKELLCTKVSTESSLCHHIVAESHRHLRGQHAGATMGNVGKRTTMYISRSMFGGLYQIGVESIAQQYGNSACHTKVLHLEKFAIGSDTQHDILDATLQILLTGCQTENGHQFRCGSNVEARLRHHTITTKSRHHISQGTVIHVEHTFPEDLTQRETFFAVLVDVVVEHRTDRVMR